MLNLLLFFFFIELQDLESFFQLVLFPLFRIMILCSVVEHEDVNEIHLMVHFLVFEFVFDLHVQDSFLHVADAASSPKDDQEE